MCFTMVVRKEGVKMKNSISIYISNLLVEQSIIKKEDADVCRYGIEFFIVSVLEILSILILSLFLGNFSETLFYFIAFIPLRLYAGGYHADSKLKCYIILIAVYVAFTVLLKIIPTSCYTYIELFSIILTVIMILKFAPIVSSKKNINEKETAFYRKVCIWIMFIELAVLIIGILNIPENKYICSFSLGQLAVSLSMIAAFVKNKTDRRWN